METPNIKLALGYFSEQLQLLPQLEIEDDIIRRIDVANGLERLLFMDAVLTSILKSESDDIPEAVVIDALWAICNNAYSELPQGVCDDAVPWDLRTSVLTQMQNLFIKIFPKYCDNSLVRNASSDWNRLCFMWWDVLPMPVHLDESSQIKIGLFVVKLLGQLLEVDHLASKEAALHGLGHWQLFCPDEAIAEIDSRQQYIPDVLRRYAIESKSGDIR